MIEFLQQFNPIVQALLATLFTWGLTAAGAALVFMHREVNPKLLDGMLGFAAGVMIAASFWSLLAPGIEMAEQLGDIPWLTASVGFMGGGIFMRLTDKILPHLHPGLAMCEREGIKTSWQRSTLLVLAITLHNIPEGMAVGVASGSGMDNAQAFSLAIALQDIPEGLVIALSLATAGVRRGRAVLIGVLSGLVEPVGAMVAAVAVGAFTALLPWGLTFAAGAMLFAVSHEVIPESHRNGHETWATLGLTLGFCLMMVMDTGLV